MSNDMRIVKFETFVKDVNEAANRSTGMFASTLLFSSMVLLNKTKECNNPSLLLIYDYEKLNDYGKVIMEQSSQYLIEWEKKYSTIESLKDTKTKIYAAKELIKYCRTEVERKESYKFIFWAMMVLTVDKTDHEEKLSLICDFAKMLKITDEEMLDILQVIKVLYHEEENGFKFKSQTVPSYFSRVLSLYN